jgi:hypothetical protein
MNFPEGYLRGLTVTRLQRHFPNLVPGQNFEFTSLKTDDYNCVAWSTEIEDEWIDFPYDEQGNYDDNIDKYITYFKNLGFVEIKDSNPEDGVSKIAIYGDNENNFKHVARLLPNGKWTSKIGDWEDIQHDTLEALSGNSYGHPILLMQKKTES